MTTPTNDRVKLVSDWLRTNTPDEALYPVQVARVFKAIEALGWGVHLTNGPLPDLGAVSPGRTRHPDRATSHAGARDVAYRAGSQKHRLLVRYEEAGWGGLTDEEAGDKAALGHTCYWKRCGELRADKLIEVTGRVRVGAAGTPRIVSRITDHGEALLRKLARR